MNKYLTWVKSLPCVHCKAPADDPHHLIGFGGKMGGKAHDLFAVPLCRGCHTEFHDTYGVYGDDHKVQAIWLMNTLEQALQEGVINVR